MYKLWLIVFIWLLTFTSLQSFGSGVDNPYCGKPINIETYKAIIDYEEITPDTWKSIYLVMVDNENIRIDLLRPNWWLDKSGAKIGGLIELSIPEMGD